MLKSIFHPSWQPFLNQEFDQPYFKKLAKFLHQAYQNQQIFPPKHQVFSVFTTNIQQISVVILGQDPYHTPKMAHGLAFSVPEDQPLPPSLINIYKTIDKDLGKHQNQNGCLKPWQDQGVFLLNTALTVKAHQAGSHRQIGWEIFTDNTIKYLSQIRPHLVFLLWGRDAKTKKPLIDSDKHLILESVHPSPLSAHRGFFENRHFSQANIFLKNHQLPPINW